MKHLIIFLDYNRSRLENPVYRIFASYMSSAKEVSLLFLPGKLEERDLIHQTNELRQKEEGIDITFHICSHALSDPDGEHAVSSVRQIRKLFLPSDEYTYPIFIYGQIEKVKNCDPARKKLLWNYLCALNKAAIKYYDCNLINGVYLYHDPAQTSLADYLYYTILSDVPSVALSPAVRKNAPKQWAPVFGALNVCGLSYPEEEIRQYLHLYHLQTVLGYSQPENNPVDMEACILLAEDLARNIPLETERLTLQEEAFLNLPEENGTRWMTVKNFWTKEIEKTFDGLADIHRQEWLNKVYKNTTVLYQTRFRQVGVEYFFKLQEKKTEEYCRTLVAIITERFNQQVQKNPFTPEAFRSVINALINILQQKRLEIQQQIPILEQQTKVRKKDLETQKEAWGKLTIINRMMGKDKQILEQYKQTLTSFYITKTRWAGSCFAIKLLNELIIHTATLKDRCDKLEEKLQSALDAIDAAVIENNPDGRFGIFDGRLLAEAETAIKQDKTRIQEDYSTILKKIASKKMSADSYDLPNSFLTLFKEKTDKYLDTAIADGTFPPVLNISIVDRIRQIYEGGGGMDGFMQELKERIPILLEIKQSDGAPGASDNIDDEENEKYIKKFLLILPSTEQEWTDETFCLHSPNTIGLIHLCYGLRLTQLEGFSGQRVTFEPSIF